MEVIHSPAPPRLGPVLQVLEQSAAEGELPGVAYFAIAEDPEHRPNRNLTGFWAADREEVDSIAQLVRESGGTVTAGPKLFPISPTYYAVYFEDPCGNAYEIVYRLN
ncbi:VOC family protein [Paenibacillus ehimensis]|uniref:VOC family protein n=1 Tax=Paenibacillus ehimensis TaxID=79264 RepID=A0ABT8VH92_9BACL|nr:VOC family protein [Paenibacillus ehimensis]MDO3680359.1 VOC family protein [Paenibacillus ehimensis]